MRRRLAILLLPLLLAGCANGGSATFDFYLGLTVAAVNQIALVQLGTMSDEELAAHRVDVARWEARAGLLESGLQSHLAAVDAEIAARQQLGPVARQAWRCSSILCSTGVEVCTECLEVVTEAWHRAHGGG